MAYRKFSDAWRREPRPEPLGGLDGLGALRGVEVQIPNVAESKTNILEAVESVDTEISGEKVPFRAGNRGEPDTEIHPWGPPKPAKAPKVDGQREDAVWSDTEEERAAIIEYGAGVPRAWAEALARLNPSAPPAGVRDEDWIRFIDACARFIDAGWHIQANALGWGPLELFGCDRGTSFAKVEAKGLLWQIGDGDLVALTPTVHWWTQASAMSISLAVRPYPVKC